MISRREKVYRERTRSRWDTAQSRSAVSCGNGYAAGVHIFPGYSLHEELQRFVAAGFTPLEALQTATINPAVFSIEIRRER